MELLNNVLTTLETTFTKRILFIETLHLKGWNGYTARYKKGISGTHSASMYLAEALVEKGFHVDFVSPNIINIKHLGVNYINFEWNNGIDKVYDYVFITNNMLDLQLLNKVVHYKKLFIVMHNPLLQAELVNLFSLEKEKTVFAFLSPSSKKAICLQQPSLNNYQSMYLYNSIEIADLQPINQKENAFVFFACSDRGYSIAASVADAFPTFKLYSNTYANELKYLLREHTTDSSKVEMFKCLAKSKYFVYPLINLEKGCIHYDCAPYVILEALLHGVIVITVRNSVFEELYGDAVCYIESDDLFSMDCFKTWSNKIEIKMEFKDFINGYTERFIDKVIELEGDIDLQNKYIQRGLALKERYSNKTIATQLINYIVEPPLPRVLLFITSFRQLKEFEYYSFFFNRFTTLNKICDLYIHCNNKDISEDLVKYYKKFNLDNKHLFISSKNLGYTMGNIEALSDSYDSGIFSQYDYIIHSHPDVFMLEEEPIVNLLKKNMKTDTAFYISQGLPDDQSFLQTDFFIFKPNLLSINIFKYDINNWKGIGEHYMYYILTKYNIKYELIKRFDNNTWHPRRIDNYKVWHEHDLSLVEAYIQNLEKTSSALSIA